jgi:uncharacterized protein (DUF1330 family)
VSCHFIAQVKIHDPREYQRYLEGFDEIFASYKGKVVVVDDNPTILEGDWPYTRLVLIRFPDKAEAKRWYDSPEYQRLAQHRFNASEATAILVDGLS